METIGFLHTSPVHVATFDGLVAELAPDRTSICSVDESLLAAARTTGLDDPMLTEAIERALADLAGRGARVVICTCSTIGGLAEVVGRRAGIEVVRADRPMIESAVTTGDRIGVVAAVDATVGPTQALIESVAADRGRKPTVIVHFVDGAWSRFESGDFDGYLEAVAAALPGLAAACDVIVLAQASMAAAATLVEVSVPVLSSPALAVASIIR